MEQGAFMKKILYIGNKLEKHGKAPTSVDILPSLFEKEGLKVVACSDKENKLFRVLDIGWNILKHGRKFDYVLIDTYSTLNFWYAAGSGVICHWLGIKYIPILRGGGLANRLEKNKWISKFYFNNSYVNISPSSFLIDQFSSEGITNSKFIPNTIPFENYLYTKRTKVKANLLWVRAFDQVYNALLALETIELLRKTWPDVKLIMVGPDKDGSLNELKKIADQKQLPVHFTGKLSKQEWLALSRDCDIFINTTNIDNTPVSLIEAMALGLPVVSTNVGGIPYLIDHEENGLLVPPDDAEKMSDAICRLLNEPGLAERISENGRAKVKNFDWEQVKGLWLELLD